MLPAAQNGSLTRHAYRPMQLLRFQTFAPQFSLRKCHDLKPRTAELWTKNIVSLCNTRLLHKKVGRRCRLSPNKTYELHFFSLRKMVVAVAIMGRGTKKVENH